MAVIDPLKTRPTGPRTVPHGFSSNFDDDEEKYPSSDGKPMAETVEHRELMYYSTFALSTYLEKRPDVWVSGNDFIYYQEGNARARVSPDCYVVFGVPRRTRKSFRIWEEQKRTPNVVFEFTSKKTRKEDQTFKRQLYQNVLRVPEYFLFDPSDSSYLKPRLQGYRLSNGVYVPLALIGGDRLLSEQLGLELTLQGTDMRFYDPIGKRFLLSGTEERERANTESARANAEAARAEAEAARAEVEAANARAEATRANAAEAELARLRAELDAVRRQLSRSE